MRKVLIHPGRGIDRDSPAAPDTGNVTQAGQDKNRDKQASPNTDKAEQEVPDKSISGHVSKDSDNAGRGATRKDRDLAEPVDMHTDKGRHAFAHTEKAAGKKSNNTDKAGQKERDTLRGGHVDRYEDKTLRENVDAIPETTSQLENSGKRKKMELRRRSKIKVFIITLKLTDSIKK